MRALRLILCLVLVAAAAPAAADTMRYLSFDAASESARWRTGDITLAIRKGILLLHDPRAQTAAMLPAFLRYLREHGYRVVHIVPAGSAADPAKGGPIKQGSH